MKKVLFIITVAVIVAGISNVSWAMGRKSKGSSGHQNFHHHGGTQSGSFSKDQYSNEDDSQAKEGDEQDGVNRFAKADDEGFPATTTVPEPATLALMGMGLSGLLLRKRRS